MNMRTFGVCTALLALSVSPVLAEAPQIGIPVRVWAAATSGSGNHQINGNYIIVEMNDPIQSGFTFVAYTSIGGVTKKILQYSGTTTATGYISMTGTFLQWTAPIPGAPNVQVGGPAGASQIATSAGQSIQADFGLVRMEPGKVYTISAVYLNATGTLNVVPPPGYRTVLNGMVRNGCPLATSMTVRILPISGGAPQRAGFSSSVAALKVDWKLSLGSLHGGDDAGYVELVDTGLGANWDALCTPGALSYAATSDEVFVLQQAGALRQVIANQVALDIVTLTATSYEIRCYTPAQIQSYVPCSFSGRPFAVYRIEKGATATSIKFTRETRNVTDPVTMDIPIARTETMTLERSGTAPNFTWIKTDWTVLGQAPLSGTTVTTTSTSTTRAESVTLAVPAGATALRLTRNYTLQSNGEELTGEVLGTSNSRTSGFGYYTDTAQPGSFGYIKSIDLPGGGWESYDYYDTTVTTGYQMGQVKMKFRPFGNSPATVTRDPSQGEVTYFEYDVDPFGFRTRLKDTQTFVNGVQVARSSMTYGDGSGYAPYVGGIVRQTRKDYTSAANLIATVSHFFPENDSDAFRRGKLVFVERPDGTKQCYAYARGTWDGTIFTAGTGPASRVVKINGTASGSGSWINSYGGSAIGLVYLHSGSSTAEVSIRDDRALVVRTEMHVWNASAWHLVSFTNFTYNFMGLPTSRVSSNGARYTATYDGLLKTSETDESGLTTSYLYDAAGRVSTASRAGYGAIGSLSTRFIYDAAGNVLREEVGVGLSEQLVTTKQFDDAGRVIAETVPGQNATTHAYDVPNRMQTSTKPDGGTVIATVYRDGRPYSKAGTAVVAEYMTYGVESATGNRWTRVNTGTSTSPRWQHATKDWAGRDFAKVSPVPTSTTASWDGNLASTSILLQRSFYNDTTSGGSMGHLTKTTETADVSGEMASTLYIYDDLGRLYRSGLDITNNGALDLASNDRINEKLQSFESWNGAWWAREESKSYASASSSTASTMGLTRKRLTGFPAGRLAEEQTTDTLGNVTTKTTDVDRATATTISTTSTTGVAQPQVEIRVAGLQVSSKNAAGLTTSTSYDSLLRPSEVTDSRGNKTKTTYITGTKLAATVIQPYISPGHASNITVATNTYDTSGRLSSSTNAGGHVTYSSYTLRGQPWRTWGAAAIPVEYGYDPTYGEKTTMKTFRGGTGWDGSTWPASPGTADTTTWAHDGATGVLTSKTDAASKAVTYTYTKRKQLATRTWSRGIVTTYAYYPATAEQFEITYTDSTPALEYSYNRLGQSYQIEDATGIRTLAHCLCGKVSSETLDGFFYGSRILTYKLDQVSGNVLGRTVGYRLTRNGTTEQETTYTYSPISGRLTDLATLAGFSAANRTFHYAYLLNAPMLESLSVDSGHPFTITRTFEPNRDVLTSIDTKWSTTSRARYDYTVNNLGQRSSIKQSGDVFADYGDSTFRSLAYDSKGQLTSDTGYLGNAVDSNKLLPDRKNEYAYDNIGNRHWSNVTGNSTLRDDYTTNSLNLYVTKENNALTVSGTADTNAKVVVGGSSVVALRKGAFWSDQVTVSNVLRPWRGPLTVHTGKANGGPGGTTDLLRTDTRMGQIPQQSQTLTYDDDGNLTSDGVWDYMWDAENRLIRMTSTSESVLGGFPNRRMEFKYDYLGRRVQKLVFDHGSNQLLSARRFLYDGWNLIAELSLNSQLSSLAVARTYTWGLDIVHSLNESGGVGALIQVADNASSKAFFPAYDGNGNIVGMLNGASGSGALAAAYEYSPYGEPLRSQTLDAALADQPFRFSTKYTDGETGLVYYGRRYYSPGQGRFLGRDPIGEEGGINLYGFVSNSPVNHWDYLGMQTVVAVPLPTFLVRAKPIWDPNAYYADYEWSYMQYEADLALWEKEYAEMQAAEEEWERRKKRCDELRADYQASGRNAQLFAKNIYRSYLQEKGLPEPQRAAQFWKDFVSALPFGALTEIDEAETRTDAAKPATDLVVDATQYAGKLSSAGRRMPRAFRALAKFAAILKIVDAGEMVTNQIGMSEPYSGTFMDYMSDRGKAADAKRSFDLESKEYSRKYEEYKKECVD